jgi:hypothetical protein
MPEIPVPSLNARNTSHATNKNHPSQHLDLTSEKQHHKDMRGIDMP